MVIVYTFIFCWKSNHVWKSGFSWWPKCNLEVHFKLPHHFCICCTGISQHGNFNMSFLPLYQVQFEVNGASTNINLTYDSFYFKTKKSFQPQLVFDLGPPALFAKALNLWAIGPLNIIHNAGVLMTQPIMYSNRFITQLKYQLKLGHLIVT